MLKVKNLKIQFTHDGKAMKAIDGIDFEIKENEVVGLVGESGSGKTVTALSIMKLLPTKDCATTGEIIFEGKNLAVLNEKEILNVRGSKIAMVFQEPFTSLNPVMRAGEQIAEAIFAHRKISKKETEEKSISLLEKVKIRDPRRIYDSYPHLLSGGERQRVMIAMAIAMKPKLLIADEPTTALDVTIQSEILELLLGLKKDLSMSVLFITHDFGIINKVADRVLVLNDGKIIESGEKSEILSAPKEDYTKKLLLAVPKITFASGKKEATGEKSAITVEKLSKTFVIESSIFKRGEDRVCAVSDVSLEIKKGRTLGIVGESGSGKTTLGKLLIGLLKPDSGSIQYSRKTASAAGVQIVFQDPYSSLDPRMRMQDIVLEGLTIRGVKKEKKESVLRDVLFKAHLNYKSREKHPHQFSGGQRQRIAIARALAVNPEILILDEPVSSLDVIIQKEILNLLKELQKELGLTYVFISHDLRVVEYMADDVAVMQKGEIVEFAARDEIYRSPKHPYTKRLLSSVL